MGDDSLLNLNYPLQSTQLIRTEAKVKQSLRNMSLNAPEPREIERYSDRYAASIPHSLVLQSIDVELIGPELQKIHGLDSGGDVDVILDDVGEEESLSRVADEDGDGSLDGGDDYNENYYDDDELVEESKNYGNEETF